MLQKSGVSALVLLACITLSAILSFAGSKEILSLNFKNGYSAWDTSQRSGGTFAIVEYAKGQAVKIHRNSIGDDRPTFLRYMKIPIEYLKGKRVMVLAKVKAENIDIGDKSFYGGHLDFEMRTSKGFDYRCTIQDFFTGTFDWRPESFECTVPEDVKTIDLRIGLQGASGATFFDDIKVFTIEQ